MVASPNSKGRTSSIAVLQSSCLTGKLADGFSKTLTMIDGDDESSVQASSTLASKSLHRQSKRVRFRSNESGQILRHMYTYPSAKNSVFASDVYWSQEEMLAIRQECQNLVKSTAKEHPYYIECIETIFKAAHHMIKIDSVLVNTVAMFPTRGLETHATRTIKNKKLQARKDILIRYNHLVYHTDLQAHEIAAMLSEYCEMETRGCRLFASKMGQADRNEADLIHNVTI